MVFKRGYETIAGFFPDWLLARLSTLMIQGGFEDVSPRAFLGFTIFFASSIALIVFFLSPFFVTLELGLHAGLAVLAFAAVIALFYVFLQLNADARARKIEDVLPDALKIVSANIRAGMTLEQAVWGAARPEFGAFRDEIRKVSADAFGGKPLPRALELMSTRVKSQVLSRSVRLINEGVKLGGEMARLLDEVAEDIRGIQLLRKEIATSTLTYSLFIVFAALFAAPLLFAVSAYYAELNEGLLLGQATGVPAGAISGAVVQQAQLTGLPEFAFGRIQKQGIAARDVYWFAVSSIAVTTFFAGLTLGLIRSGKALRGLKYSPLFVAVGLSVFLLAHSLLKSVFTPVLR